MGSESLADIDRAQPAADGDAVSRDLVLLRDYWNACLWFGWMPLAEFASGYRTMEARYGQLKVASGLASKDEQVRREETFDSC